MDHGARRDAPAGHVPAAPQQCLIAVHEFGQVARLRRRRRDAQAARLDEVQRSVLVAGPLDVLRLLEVALDAQRHLAQLPNLGVRQLPLAGAGAVCGGRPVIQHLVRGLARDGVLRHAPLALHGAMRQAAGRAEDQLARPRPVRVDRIDDAARPRAHHPHAGHRHQPARGEPRRHAARHRVRGVQAGQYPAIGLDDIGGSGVEDGFVLAREGEILVLSKGTRTHRERQLLGRAQPRDGLPDGRGQLVRDLRAADLIREFVDGVLLAPAEARQRIVDHPGQMVGLDDAEERPGGDGEPVRNPDVQAGPQFAQVGALASDEVDQALVGPVEGDAVLRLRDDRLSGDVAHHLVPEAVDHVVQRRVLLVREAVQVRHDLARQIEHLADRHIDVAAVEDVLAALLLRQVGEQLQQFGVVVEDAAESREEELEGGRGAPAETKPPADMHHAGRSLPLDLSAPPCPA